MFHKFYACFCLAIALVRQCYGLLYIHLPAKLFEHVWCKVHSCIWNNFLKPKFCKCNISCFNNVICCETVSPFHNGKHAVVLYNAQKCFNSNKNISASTISQGSAWYFIWDYLLMWFVSVWHSKHVTHFFIMFFDVCIHVHPIHWLPHNLIFSIPIWFLCNCSSICLCNRKRYYSSALHNTVSDHCQLTPNWSVVLHAMFQYIFVVWPSLYYVLFLAWVCILSSCCLCVFYWCAYWYIYWCDDSIHVYVYASDFLVPVSYIVTQG